MTEAAHRANAVILDMLDYSSDRELEKHPACPNALIRKTLRLVRNDFNKGKVRVITNLQEGICQCSLDSLKMEQVLINIFANACQSLSEGGLGGVVTVTTSEETVEADDPPTAPDEATSALPKGRKTGRPGDSR